MSPPTLLREITATHIVRKRRLFPYGLTDDGTIFLDGHTLVLGFANDEDEANMIAHHYNQLFYEELHRYAHDLLTKELIIENFDILNIPKDQIHQMHNLWPDLDEASYYELYDRLQMHFVEAITIEPEDKGQYWCQLNHQFWYAADAKRALYELLEEFELSDLTEQACFDTYDEAVQFTIALVECFRERYRNDLSFVFRRALSTNVNKDCPDLTEKYEKHFDNKIIKDSLRLRVNTMPTTAEELRLSPVEMVLKSTAGQVKSREILYDLYSNIEQPPFHIVKIT